MKNRGDRLYRKAQIRKRLIARAIQTYNRNRLGLYGDGLPIERIRKKEELPRSGFCRIGRVLRDDGGGRDRLYRCGFCEWCVDNLTLNSRRKNAAANAAFAEWLVDASLPPVSDALWERIACGKVGLAEALYSLAQLCES